MSTEQQVIVKQSLLNNAFAQYHELIKILKALPITQETNTMQHAYLSIDTGMLWIKELIMTSPIIMTEQPPAPVAPVAVDKDLIVE
jgi:hypothetical protein